MLVWTTSRWFQGQLLKLMSRNCLNGGIGMLFRCTLALAGLIPLQESLWAFNRDPSD